MLTTAAGRTEQRDQLFANSRAAIDGMREHMIKWQLADCDKADPEYGVGVATRLGLKVSDLPCAVAAE